MSDSYYTDAPNANSDVNLTDLQSDFVNGSSSNMTFIDVCIEELAYVLNVYFTPALVLLGTIGNLLSIIVFFRSKLRTQSTSQYLTALAISDTIFLLQLIPPWMKTVRLSLIFGQEGFCQCFVYLTYVSSSCSSWLVVSFTVERFVAVLYPLRRTRMCTVRRARLLIVAILCCCMAVNTPVLMFALPKGNECNIDYELMDHAARFNVVDTIFSFTLPLTIITVLNIWIMIGVCQLSRARRLLIKEKAVHKRGGARRVVRSTLSGRRRRIRSSLQHSQQRITRMLLSVSSVFVLLNLPAYSMRIVAYAKNMSSSEYNGRWAALQQICLLFFNSNFGINFFLYCMTGQNFRRELCETFSCVDRARASARSLCCGRPEGPATTRPSVTNSLSINTEASAYAAPSRVSTGQDLNEPEVTSSRRKTNFGKYLKQLYLKNSEHDQQKRVHCELHDYPVQIDRYSPGRRLERPVPRWPERPMPHRPERPVPRWPENALRMTRTEPANVTISPTTEVRPLMFRPIRYELVPGQIAPPHPYAHKSRPSLLEPSSPIPLAPPWSLLPDNTTPPSPDDREIVPTIHESASANNLSPIERPQLRRKLSLPARQLNGLERENTPPAWEDNPLPRWRSLALGKPAPAARSPQHGAAGAAPPSAAS